MAFLINPPPTMSTNMIFRPKPFLSSSFRNQTFDPLRQSRTKPISACFKQHNFAGSMNGRGSSSMFLHRDNRKNAISMMLQDEPIATAETKDDDHDPPSESSLVKFLQDRIKKMKESIYQLPMMLNDEAIRTGLWKFVSETVAVLANTKFKILYSFFKNIVLPIYAKLRDTNLTTKSTKRPDEVEGVDAELQQTTSVNPQCEEGTAIEDGDQEFVEMEDVSMEFGSQN